MTIICFCHLRWNFVYQRPQHLMSRLAKHFRVYYIEEPFFDAYESYLDYRQEQQNLWVVVPHLPPGLTEHEASEVINDLVDDLPSMSEQKSIIAWYYTPMAYDPKTAFDAELVIYDCMDELSAFRFAPASLKLKEKQLMERADLVFTGGYSLYEAKKSNHLNIHLFPSSIHIAHFEMARTLSTQMDDQKLIGYPRIGFFGVIDERMDIVLLNDLAIKRPDWHFVMIGPIVKIDPDTLPRHNNIYYLGQKTYNELPNYIAHWDVAMMPFVINESTRFISPTKTPEYLAAGKPVVSTPVHDVIRSYGESGFVYFGSTADQFIEAIGRALSIADKSKWLKAVDELLSANSWDLTCEKMLMQINRTLSKQKQQKKEMRNV
jgi:glycosyltransferase involved in cell wall biosynthesis